MQLWFYLIALPGQPLNFVREENYNFPLRACRTLLKAEMPYGNPNHWHKYRPDRTAGGVSFDRGRVGYVSADGGPSLLLSFRTKKPHLPFSPNPPPPPCPPPHLLPPSPLSAP